MKTIKSEQNIKISFNKYQNFFTEKNWKDAMYMDDRAAQKPDLDTRMKKSSSLATQPRTKLSLSLTEKAGAILSDPRKMGMLEKVPNSKTRKSMAKISYTSTLPPIKTQTLQTSQYLNKLKNQLDDFSLKSIKLEKQTSQMRASINQSRERVIALKQKLNTKKQKQQEQIARLSQTTIENKYTFEVRSNMADNLKTDIRALAKRNNNLEARLKMLKTELHSASAQLDNNRKSLNNNIYNKKLYETKQDFQGEQFRNQSITAQKKLKHEKQAQKIRQKLQNLERYGQDEYRYQTNLQNHFKTLNELRVQQVINGIISSLYNKSQTEWQEYERSYSLMKMYSLLNNHQKNDNLNKSQNSIQNRSMISNSNKSIINPIQPDSQFNVVQLYEESFKVKQELQKKIKEKQILQVQLQKKKQALYKEWVAKTFEDPFIDMNRKSDFSKQLKQLYQKQEKFQRIKKIQQEFYIWERKQQQRLGLKLSKKILAPERFSKILEYLLSEGKKLKHTEPTDSQRVSQKDKEEKTKNKAVLPTKEVNSKKSSKNSWA